jgi:hypothetical protein
MEIIDNFLDAATFSEFSEIVRGFDMPWYTNRGVASPYDGEIYFTHVLFKDLEARSDLFRFLQPFTDYAGVRALIRAKINLFPRTTEVTKHEMHTDFDYPHNGMLFYINSNNGVTTLDDGTEIESVANRLVMFDSSAPHCSSTCSDEMFRITMNINYF